MLTEKSIKNTFEVKKSKIKKKHFKVQIIYVMTF